MGLIRALREVLPEHAREWVYYGATVQDLSDTWFALVFRALGDIAERDVTRMRDRALELAARIPRHADVRPHPRAAGLPITFGFKAAVWAAELDRHLDRLRQGRARWEVVQLGGALGTMEFWGGRALDLLDRVRRPAGPGRAGHPLAHRPGRGGRVHLAAGGDLGDGRQDRQRGVPAAAA